MFQTRVSVWDAIAVACVVLAAVLLIACPLLFAAEGEFLQITSSRGVETYRLSEDREITLQEGEILLVIVIEDGEAYVRHSTCPDGICCASGRISESGESILCAPAGVTLSVKGGADDVDFVAG